ncbi:hypothetical protein ACWD25_02305 [Streptomyces sp. NPDC002920]
MHTSIAQAPGVARGKTTAETERDDLRDLLAAIRDALTLPPSPQRPLVLGDRALLVVGTIRDVLDGQVKVPLIPFETEALRQKTREDGGSHA